MSSMALYILLGVVLGMWVVPMALSFVKGLQS